MTQPNLQTIYNGRKIELILYDRSDETVDIRQISYMGNHFKPEKNMRNIRMWYPDFLKFHEKLVETLTIFNKWQTEIVTKFTVCGGWSMPKDVCDIAKHAGIAIEDYARWFWPLDNNWTMCALFTQSNVKDLVSSETETQYTGKCTMNVQFYFLRTLLVQRFFDSIQKEMGKPRPTNLVELPIQMIPQIVACVCCGNTPDPMDVTVCPEGHYTCSKCAFKGQRDEMKKSETKHCCRVENLRKESPHLLKLLLDNMYYKCIHFGSGCQQSFNDFELYQENSQNCDLTISYKCRYNGCTGQYKGVKMLVEHYTQVHDGSVLDVGNSILLPIYFKETLEGRLLALLKVKGYYYIFACEVKEDVIYVWVWDLEHKATGMGQKTSMTYDLNLKQVRKHQDIDSETVKKYRGNCMGHEVEPEHITIPYERLTDSYRMNVDSFKYVFVENTLNGHGKWIVTVCINEK